MVERVCVFPSLIGSSGVRDRRLRGSFPDLSFVVPAESLLVASGVDDVHLVGLLKQIDCVLLSLCSSIAVESLHSWGTVVKIER